MRRYKTEQEGARGLLGEAVKIISQCDIDYVIVGGWIPYLFHTSIYPHPGSFDVDMLLNDKTTTKDQMEKAVQKFKSNGYLFSAKNKFQLHKILDIAGEQIIFHVDFLHRMYAPDQDEGMFIDWNPAISIAGPGTDIIFSDNEREKKELTFDLPDGETEKISINFASEIGFISAKGRALDTPKRVRDSYDIFLILCQSTDYTKLLNKSYEYYHNKSYFALSIDNIYKFFTVGKDAEHNGIVNTKKYLEKYRPQLKDLPDDLDTLIKTRVCGFIEKLRQK